MSDPHESITAFDRARVLFAVAPVAPGDTCGGPAVFALLAYWPGGGRPALLAQFCREHVDGVHEVMGRAQDDADKAMRAGEN